MADRSFTRRDVLRISAVAGAGAALGTGVVSGLLRRAALHRVWETRAQLGTLVTISALHPDVGGATEIVERGFSEMERLEAILSRYRPSSALARLNAEGRLDQPPPELRAVLAASLDLARATDGAFDPTIGPVLSVYAEQAERGALPSEAAIAAALRLVGHDGLRMDGDGIELAHPAMTVTLDGIAKGHVVDRTTATLVEAGAEAVLVDAGGDMASGGPGVQADPWAIDVAHPRGRDPIERVRLAGGAVATSGDYMQSFTEDRSAHHVIDPRTGRSPRAVASASVTAGTAMAADAWSTALMVLGAEAGFELLRERAGVEGAIVTKDGEEFRSEGFGRPA